MLKCSSFVWFVYAIRCHDLCGDVYKWSCACVCALKIHFANFQAMTNRGTCQFTVRCTNVKCSPFTSVYNYDVHVVTVCVCVHVRTCSEFIA